MNKKNVLNRILKEVRVYLIYAAFLTFLLSTFTIYQRILLHQYSNQYIHYGYSIIEALILAKIIIIGQSFKLGERFARMPLIVPVTYKTFLFCLLLIFFELVEHVVVLLYSGANFSNLYQEFAMINTNIIFAKTFVMLIVFYFFFSFLELARVLGGKKLIKLFFVDSNYLS